MRELDECTAEVFRRGEKRIEAHRRARNRVFALCVPVCLIAAVWSVTVFPAVTPDLKTGDCVQAVGETVENAGTGPACPYTAVEIQGAGMLPEWHTGKITDPAAAADMFRAVRSLFEETGGNAQNAGESAPSPEDHTYHDRTDSVGTEEDCTIIFTSEEGLRAVYFLSGNTLTDADTNETVSLSDVQAAGLMAVLGLDAPSVGLLEEDG